MAPDQPDDIAERDQLWANLQGLQEEIARLATGEWDGSQRQKQLSVLLARIVLAELEFQSRQ